MSAVGVCDFCREPVSPTATQVRHPRDPRVWHEPCWALDNDDLPVDFAGYDRGDREVAWQARGGKRGAGL